MGKQEMVRKLGGTSKDDLLRGDYGSEYYGFGPEGRGGKVQYGGGDGNDNQTKATFGHYQYRNTPVATYYYALGYPSTMQPQVVYTLRATKPKVKFKAFEPYFNNERNLKGRAVVSDTFSVPWNSSGGVHHSMSPGYAWWAHKEGYNVLYGDHSVRWYGDVNGDIMYWPAIDRWNTTCLSTNTVEWDCSPAEIGNVYWWPAASPNLVWHLFDMQAGIDEGLLDDTDY